MYPLTAMSQAPLGGSVTPMYATALGAGLPMATPAYTPVFTPVAAPVVMPNAGIPQQTESSSEKMMKTLMQLAINDLVKPQQPPPLPPQPKANTRQTGGVLRSLVDGLFNIGGRLLTAAGL